MRLLLCGDDADGRVEDSSLTSTTIRRLPPTSRSSPTPTPSRRSKRHCRRRRSPTARPRTSSGRHASRSCPSTTSTSRPTSAKVKNGKSLSPVLLVRGELRHDIALQIADGYHRVCASYHLAENTDIPYRMAVVDREPLIRAQLSKPAHPSRGLKPRPARSGSRSRWRTMPRDHGPPSAARDRRSGPRRCRARSRDGRARECRTPPLLARWPALRLRR